MASTQLPNLHWMEAKKGQEVPWDPTSSHPFNPKMSFSAGVVSHTTAWPQRRGKWTGALPMPRHAARGLIMDKYAVWRYFLENPAEVPVVLEEEGRAVAPGGHGKRTKPLPWDKRALTALNRVLGTCCVCTKSKMTCYHHDLQDLEREYRNLKANGKLPEIVERGKRNFETVSKNNEKSKRTSATSSSSPDLAPGSAPASVPLAAPFPALAYHQAFAPAAVPSVPSLPVSGFASLPPADVPLPTWDSLFPSIPPPIFRSGSLSDPEHTSPPASFGELPLDPMAQGSLLPFLLAGFDAAYLAASAPVLAEDAFATAYTGSYPVSVPVGYMGGSNPTFSPDSAPVYFAFPPPAFDAGSFLASAPVFPRDIAPDYHNPDVDFDPAVPAVPATNPFIGSFQL
ncbi:hypothetical protein PspLS_08016 [Pyricularia sp. CBS 133598]|nr:hypothetical protein PspLS_08016 [Pyricularia sp. CBS 133598]